MVLFGPWCSRLQKSLYTANLEQTRRKGWTDVVTAAQLFLYLPLRCCHFLKFHPSTKAIMFSTLHLEQSFICVIWILTRQQSMQRAVCKGRNITASGFGSLPVREESYFFCCEGKTPGFSLTGLVYRSNSKKSDVVNKVLWCGLKDCSVCSKVNDKTWQFSLLGI